MMSVTVMTMMPLAALPHGFVPRSFYLLRVANKLTARDGLVVAFNLTVRFVTGDGPCVSTRTIAAQAARMARCSATPGISPTSVSARNILRSVIIAAWTASRDGSGGRAISLSNLRSGTCGAARVGDPVSLRGARVRGKLSSPPKVASRSEMRGRPAGERRPRR